MQSWTTSAPSPVAEMHGGMAIAMASSADAGIRVHEEEQMSQQQQQVRCCSLLAVFLLYSFWLLASSPLLQMSVLAHHTSLTL